MTNVFVATFWLKSWSHFQQGWDFILWALPVGKCEGGGCHSALQHGRAVHMCPHEAPRAGVTQHCWAPVILTTAGHFSGASQAQKNMVGVVGSLFDAVGTCRVSGHGSHALLVDAIPAKMSHVAYRCSGGQVRRKLQNLDGWMVILPPATGDWSMSLKDTQCCHWCLRTLGCFTCGHFVEITISPRHGSDFLQPTLTHRGCGLHIALCFSGLADILECGSLWGGFTANLPCGCSLGCQSQAVLPPSPVHCGSSVSQGEKHKPFYPFLWLIQ